MAKKVVGILGGMGPEATVDLFLKIIRATPARTDQDHLRLIVDSNSGIPDRARAMRRQGPDALPELVATAVNLERAGADLIVIPCNTAHFFYRQIALSVRVPVLHLIRETARELGRLRPRGARVGLLATSATVEARLYHQALSPLGLELLVPGPAGQERVDRAIYPPDGMKAGHYQEPRRWLLAEALALLDRGAEVLVVGCTEIPLVLGPRDVPGYLDPGEVLARAVVREALGEGRVAWEGEGACREGCEAAGAGAQRAEVADAERRQAPEADEVGATGGAGARAEARDEVRGADGGWARHEGCGEDCGEAPGEGG